MEWRFLPRLRLHRERAMLFDLLLRRELAILPVVPDRALIVVLVRQRMASVKRTRFCFLLFQGRAKVDSVSVDLFPVTEPDFRRASVADFFAARFSPVPGSI